MLCIIYRFKVKSGQEQQFIESWSEVTQAFLQHAGALGSRLHATEGLEYIAYAQWPSREIRDAAELPDAIKRGALIDMRNCCDSIDTLYELTPVCDHLVPVDATGSES